MPTPVSLTETSTNPSFGVAVTSIRPPSGVNLTAFDNRLRTTCRTFVHRLEFVCCIQLAALRASTVRAPIGPMSLHLAPAAAFSQKFNTRRDNPGDASTEEHVRET